MSNLREAAQQAPSIEAARAMGETGGPVVEAERLAFEAWMAGHCWQVSQTWDGKRYNDRPEYRESKSLDPLAMHTRQLWAAWRDRAALAQPDDKVQPVGWIDDFCNFENKMYRWMEEEGGWRPVYDAPQPPAEQPFQPDWVNYKQGFADGKAEAEQARPENCGSGHCSCVECPAEQGAELPPLPVPDGYIAMMATGSIVVPPVEFERRNAYAVFTAEQVRQAQRDAIAADRAARGGAA